MLRYSEEEVPVTAVKAKSLLSGDFPLLNDAKNHNASMIVVKNSISSYSSAVEEDFSDLEHFIDYIKDSWITKSPLIQGKSKQQVNQNECETMMKEILRDRNQLCRILHARKHDLESSTRMFWEQVRFRNRWRPKEIEPSHLPNALPSGAWRLCGYSKEGCVMSNYKLELWDPNAYGGRGMNKKDSFEKGVEEYTRYVLYMLEQMIAKMKPEAPQKFVLIFDLKGFKASLVFSKNVRAMVRKLIYIAQSQYPERLRKVLLVNPPYGFEPAWKLIKSVLDGSTATKIKFCFKFDELLEECDPEVLPKEYGGTHDEYQF